MKKISFRNVKYSDLEEIVNIKGVINDDIFADWFNFSYEFQDSEIKFFDSLIRKYKLYFHSLLEEEIKIHFIGPIIDSVNFWVNEKRDFLGAPLKKVINNVEIGGFTDLMVAKGTTEAKIPYFFIQEFKKEGKANHPKDQLLAELLVAIELSQKNLMRGAYVFGRYWHFMILEKKPDAKYIYYVSDSCDSLTMLGIKQIYLRLQAVKQLYCE